jgi:hypothetical protein
MRRAGGVDSCTSYLRASGPGGLLFLALCLTASAGVPAPDAPPRAEYFTRFEVSDNYASGYVGGGYAFGKAGLYELGFRLRAAGANGRYHAAITMTARFSWTATTLPTNFEGQAAYLAALVGYQYQPGRGSSNSSPASKPKTSISSRTTRTTRCRAVRSVSGCKPGSWLDLSERLFLSADATYGTAFQEYWALGRLGFRARPRLSLGLEGGALGNEEYNAGRDGGFVRVNFRDFETTLSGGFTGNYLEDDTSFYLALGLYRPF